MGRKVWAVSVAVVLLAVALAVPHAFGKSSKSFTYTPGMVQGMKQNNAFFFNAYNPTSQPIAISGDLLSHGCTILGADHVSTTVGAHAADTVGWMSATSDCNGVPTATTKSTKLVVNFTFIEAGGARIWMTGSQLRRL